ncbi:hypothetical protein K1T71_002937 [Dendrolimus kikuchii]|uniref:Uncharacterized protein n=1 Tax=Dendrolimus kikuchii TaxID=765133 RepID=A0ACC1DB82_9NEOP|nr:hypothetical protein K1T71_002937 [Dendrolimus kikuchii]
MYVKNKCYREQPFIEEAPHGDFYTYYNLQDVASKCYMRNEEVIKIRTLGILQSSYGRFYLTSVNSPTDLSEPKVQLSMIYLKVPPTSTIIPYPVQVFGTLQWKKRPVIFVTIIQEMAPSLAIRMANTLNGVTNMHLAKSESRDFL